MSKVAFLAIVRVPRCVLFAGIEPECRPPGRGGATRGDARSLPGRIRPRRRRRTTRPLRRGGKGLCERRPRGQSTASAGPWTESPPLQPRDETMSLGDWIRLAPKPRELTGGDKWNVFLSYRSVSRPWVLNLYDVLRELGHTVFLDQYVLVAGDELITVLQDALAASQAGVLV